MIRLIIILILFFLQFKTIVGQEQLQSYKPIQSPRLDDSLFKQLNYSYQEFLTNKSISDKFITEYFEKEMKAIFHDCLNYKNENKLLYNDTLTNFLKSILNNIANKNNIVPKKTYKLFVSKSQIPNAYNLSSGIFIVNIGLISKLQTKEELAFVICHELAHDVQKHVFKRMLVSAQLKGSSVFKKEYRAAKKNNNEKEFFLNYHTQISKHSRASEYEADSIAAIYMANAGYSTKGSINALRILDSIDIKCYKDTINYSQVFKTKNTQFNSDWLIDVETFDLSTNLNYTLPDSLKTHPGCEDRISKVKLINGNNSELDSLSYSLYKQISLFEEIEIHKTNKELDKALFKIIQLKDLYKSNNYLNGSFLHILFELYEAKTNHTLSQNITKNDKYWPKQFNIFIVFINNLPSSYIKNLLNEFNSGELITKSKDEYLVFVHYLIKSIDLNSEQKADLYNNFCVTNNNNKFKQNLKNKLIPKTN